VTSESDRGEALRWRDDESTCFGCSIRNARGLQLQIIRVGEREVSCDLEAVEWMNGAPGIMHGGIQATVLDEAMGYACHAGADDLDVVTVEMQLRYRRPVRIGDQLVARAAVVGDDGRDLDVEAALEDAEGVVRTEARARFRILR
jgi:uncharacterized protein (TIGR00369 family)